ncbi:MAG: SDR family oxidoreductase [Candidatus Aenigmarchaeota archaeon]|nr:SDR family oxidoreductase [Candidatus Aenigmarchaeota archaeon]
MRCMVTGGAGFIGRWLCKSLLEKNNDVLCVDNLITGSETNIKEFMKNSRFSFMKHDIVQPLYVDGIDEIYHLASPASPIHYRKYNVETMLANSVGTMNMLQLARENNAKFLFASTSEIYGDPKEHPQKETYFGNVNPIGPRACYDESKRFGEAMTTCFPDVYVRIIRIFNTYGPYMSANDGRVMPNLINQALTDKFMTIYGNGSQTRSFCYVDDLVKGIYVVMDNFHKGPVNLGNLNEITILELAEKIKQLTNSKSKIIFHPLPKDDPTRRKPDITVARSLGWQPEINLNSGLEKTIEYFRQLK